MCSQHAFVVIEQFPKVVAKIAQFFIVVFRQYATGSLADPIGGLAQGMQRIPLNQNAGVVSRRMAQDCGVRSIGIDFD
jgi:hypothetical protein